MLGYPPGRRRGQQDGPRRLRPGGLRRGSPREYREFLAEIGVEPLRSHPGRRAHRRDDRPRAPDKLTWYDGPTILEAVDGLQQGAEGSRRTCRSACRSRTSTSGATAATIGGSSPVGSAARAVAVGDEVVFWPSGKALAGRVDRGLLGAAPGVGGRRVARRDHPHRSRSSPIAGDVVSPRRRAAGGRQPPAGQALLARAAPMTGDRAYKLKLATAEVEARIAAIHRVLDASDLDSSTDKRRRSSATTSPTSPSRCAGRSRSIAPSAPRVTGRFVDRRRLRHRRRRDRQRPRPRRERGGERHAKRRQALLGHRPALISVRGPADRGAGRSSRRSRPSSIDLGNLAYVADEQARARRSWRRSSTSGALVLAPPRSRPSPIRRRRRSRRQRSAATRAIWSSTASAAAGGERAILRAASYGERQTELPGGAGWRGARDADSSPAAGNERAVDGSAIRGAARIGVVDSESSARRASERLRSAQARESRRRLLEIGRAAAASSRGGGRRPVRARATALAPHGVLRAIRSSASS